MRHTRRCISISTSQCVGIGILNACAESFWYASLVCGCFKMELAKARQSVPHAQVLFPGAAKPFCARLFSTLAVSMAVSAAS